MATYQSENYLDYAKELGAQIEDGKKIEPNHVYLNPPGKNVSIFNRSLHLLEPVIASTINMPIDFFFRCEAMDQVKKHFNVQIFATDIDTAALDAARKGIYLESIGADVSPQRLKRFFIKEPRFFKVKKELRDMVVFSIQNIIKDPPFSRLDLASCRNLMIYMDSVLQKKIIPLFHYTLNPGGILFLGSSESIGEHTDFFQPLNVKWKLFERKKGLAGAGKNGRVIQVRARQR